MHQRKSPHKNTTQDSSIIIVREILFAPVRTDDDVFLINNSQKSSKPGIWVVLATETRRKLPWYTVIINALYTSTSPESCNFLSFAYDIIKYIVREFTSTRHTQTNGGHRCNQDMGNGVDIKWQANSGHCVSKRTPIPAYENARYGYGDRKHKLQDNDIDMYSEAPGLRKCVEE